MTTTDADYNDNEVRSIVESLIEEHLNQPLDEASTTPDVSSPTSVRHRSQVVLRQEAKVAALLTNILETMGGLQQGDGECTDPGGSGSPIPPVGEANIDITTQFGCSTYEDLLSTAVLNKVLESRNGRSSMSVERKKDVEMAEEVVGEGEEEEGEGRNENGGTDTDSGVSGSIRGEGSGLGVRSGGVSGAASEESLCSPCHSPPLNTGTQAQHCDDAYSTSAIPNIQHEYISERPISIQDSWIDQSDSEAPIQFKIEEHIEEIITQHLTDEEDATDDSINDASIDSPHTSPGSHTPPTPMQHRRKRRSRTTLKKENHVNNSKSDEVLNVFHLPPLDTPHNLSPKKVAFPEFGADLLRECYSEEDLKEAFCGDLILEENQWEENWLFRRENKSMKSDSPPQVPMLIPSPDNATLPTVGDKDVDELSDLSDGNSCCEDNWFDREDGETKGGDGLYPMSLKFTQIIGETANEFSQKDQEYTEDYSLPSILTVEAEKEAKHINELIKPVPKPRSLSRSEETSSEHNQTPVSSSPALSPTSPLTSASHAPLISPSSVPKDYNSAPKTTQSIWFECFPCNTRVPLGRTLRLECQVKAKAHFGVSWYFDGQLLTEDKSCFLWQKETTFHLNIFNMNPRQEGRYHVAAYTNEDVVWSTAVATCIGHSKSPKNPKVTLSLCDLIVEEGSEVTMECQVGGHPEPKVTFVRSGTPLTPSENVSIECDPYGTWALKLTSVDLHSGGQIKAIASNTMGHVMTSCYLKVVPEGDMIGPNTRQTRSPNHSSSNSLSQFQTKKKKPLIQCKSYNESNIDSKCSPSLDSQFEALYSELVSSSSVKHGKAECEDKENVENILICVPRPGTIAEREHRKWLEAKPLPNNPYAPERLVHRLGTANRGNSILGAKHREMPSEGIMQSSLHCSQPMRADLSRYSRDYHVRSTNTKGQQANAHLYKTCKEHLSLSLDVLNGFSGRSSNFVKGRNIESPQPVHWKEELREIQTDVGKRIAEIQKSIDATERDWRTRLSQRGGTTSHIATECNRTNSFCSLSKHRPKISASCTNLTCASPPLNTNSNKKQPKNRHLVYSSTEAVNIKTTLPSETYNKSLWRTVSMDTLSHAPTQHPLQYSSIDSASSGVNNKQKETVTASDSDDTANWIPHYFMRGHVAPSMRKHKKMLTKYNSENSESLIEESDSEDISITNENLHLPSVKELASKFEPYRSLGNITTNSSLNHKQKSKEHHTTSVSNRELTRANAEEGQIRNNDKKYSKEVHHSITARNAHRFTRATVPAIVAPPRDTPSPEHLGIPGRLMSFPSRTWETPQGDTSDESTTPSNTHKRTTKRRVYTGRGIRDPMEIDEGTQFI